VKKKDEEKSIWELILETHRSHKQSAGEDLADSIGLIVICALLLFVVFV
jgi:hypothetical protein